MAILDRLLLLVILGLVFAVAITAIRVWLRRRHANLRRASTNALWPALDESPDGRPGLVVFSTPSCVACRTAQEPAVQAVSAHFGSALRVVHVDIGERPGVAREFKILTAPSTVVLGRDGRVNAINQGFAGAHVLRAQLTAAGAGQASQPSPQPPAGPAPAARLSAFRR
ncbi:MAG: thioredoxin family protein [Chloroflexi bacterium]|nr:MAG: thioredoxin family protein [Chloroflexota bacterium]TME47524.1 MAG: thioredoxin family protein [Chloroflexota bacterium]